ncbi:extracellular solute-binding protein family 1 [Beutenbergia cavernae DSM 12333]|uniref:Extracellular solute-binding protein family 1 n=1 Tax=Beutenbergia cavernae (strain ATCC BAA-8 / DSM 12333 / CCUG 43141 / JCM 11478 / NBRC 16432 / NCIMB 13614 / HKI 0122) TaxID=471853 RepID=C5C3P5_BEUC1|nr:sugar ABC transporter substrate-binding protein [Beutenbergia cavernae]ACQ81954.1 extracellular solute-binding protein family 1 [Beutenbergia cavernae DSM 12333]
MHVRRQAAVVAGLVISSVALAACSGSDQGGGGTVTITYATPAEDNILEIGEEPIIEAFEAAHPDIDVEIEQLPFADYNTSLTTEMRGGGGPDIGRVNHTDIQMYSAAGFLRPLDDAIDTGPFIPGLVEVGQVGGEQVTLPLTTDARVLYVNLRLLESAGISSPPATWDELLDDVAAFAGTDAYGYGFPTDNDYSLAYEAAGPYIAAAGGQILSPDGDPAASGDEATEAALQLLQDIVATGAVPPGLDNLSGDTLAQLFAQDKLAMMLGGPWVRSQIEDYGDLTYGADWVTVPVPAREAGGSSGSAAGGWQIGVFENSEHPEEALELLAWITEAENLQALNEGEAFPPTNDGLEVAPWSEDEFYDAFATVLPNSAVPITPVPRVAEIAAAFESNLEPAVTNPAASIADGLSAFDAQAAEILQ